MSLRTPLCDLLGIEHPVVQGSPGPWSSPALTAAISEAGGLGSLGTALVAPDEIRAQVERVRSLTDRPFAVNHTLRPLSEDAYALTLELAPPVISLALGLLGRVHLLHDAAGADASSPRAARRAASARRSRRWRSCRRSSTRSLPCRCSRPVGSPTAAALPPRSSWGRRA